MKALLVLSVLFAATVRAADADPKFAQQKTKVLEHISAQMSALENLKKCVEGANDHETIKKCHETARAERQKFEGQKIDEQIKKLEDKKKALEEKKK